MGKEGRRKKGKEAVRLFVALELINDRKLRLIRVERLFGAGCEIFTHPSGMG